VNTKNCQRRKYFSPGKVNEKGWVKRGKNGFGELKQSSFNDCELKQEQAEEKNKKE
jgi:hypothetical protein